MGKLEDKLAKLEEQRARINAEIQRVRAREQQQERRDDTRRKIIVGAMLTGMIEAGKLGQFNEVWLRAELDKQLADLNTGTRGAGSREILFVHVVDSRKVAHVGDEYGGFDHVGGGQAL